MISTQPPILNGHQPTVPILNLVARDDAVLMLVDSEQRWPLCRQQPTIIGRSEKCDIVLVSRRVSRRHVQICWQGSAFVLEDLASKNGTHVNGVRCIEPTPLQNGDVIQLGMAFQLVFVDEESTEPIKMNEHQFGLRLDHENCALSVDGRMLDHPLSPPQFRLLALLEEKIDQIVSRDEIANTVWPDDAAAGITEQAIDALIRRLREHLRNLAPDRTYLETVRGHGFRLLRFPLPRDGGVL